MNFKYLIFSATLLATYSVSFAQNEIDALRFGQLNSSATARGLSLGGAVGSIGGEFSSLSVNPAGIGVYRSSEMMLTPVLRFNNVKSEYLGNMTTDDNAKLALNNFGLIFTQAAKGENYDRSLWKSFSVGIGFNRLADYNSAVTYSGINRNSSISEIFAIDAIHNGIQSNIAPPFGFFGWDGFLIDNDYNSIPYTEIIAKGGSLNQIKSWESKGSANEYTLSLGGNYQEKLMLGATVGILSYNFERNTNFTEEDMTGDLDNDFDFLSYNEYLSTTGMGFNAKLGIIYVVNDFFRFGIAGHTPTWNTFSDAVDYDITTHTENLKRNTGQASSDPISYVQPDQPFAFNYGLRTPWKAVLSATGFIGKLGFVTADYEYVDYKSMRYSMSGDYVDYERSVNDAIKETFIAGHNIRLGVEMRQDIFMGRLGFAYRTSPFKNSSDFGGDIMDLSLGAGVRLGKMFLDLAYVYRNQKVAEFAYPIQPNNYFKDIATMKHNNNLLALTLGFKF